MAITVEQFIERLTQSGLMSAAEVSQFQGSLPPERRPKDVQQLAQALVRQGKLTKYQVQAVYQGKTKGLVFGEYTVLDQIGAGGRRVVLYNPVMGCRSAFRDDCVPGERCDRLGFRVSLL
jgi:hypothetical protein